MAILVVEDEPPIADFIMRGLRAEGHAVRCATDGISGLEGALEPDIELVVLDRMLPGRDGLVLLRDLREQRPALPVIVLTARAAVEDRVQGLDAGATDYLVKPFAFAELAARVRAHLRTPPELGPAARLAHGAIEMDLLAHSVTQGGRAIRLSAKEWELLHFFMRNPGRVLTREQILQAVWGYEHDPNSNIAEVYVSYLRRKLGPNAPIATVRNAGYRLT